MTNKTTMETAAPPLPLAATTMDDVVAHVGIQFYTYMAPRDLVSLSLTNQQSLEYISENLFTICVEQRRLMADDDDDNDGENDATDSSVVISSKHSYTSRGEIVESLLGRIKAENLRYDPPGSMDTTDTLAETIAMAQKDLKDESLWCDDGWCGTFRSDPAEIWKPLKKFSVGCRFAEELERGRSRRCFIDFMLRELPLISASASTAGQIVRDWARYLIAQRGVVGQEWQWTSDGVEAVGFMIRTPTGHELEIRLTTKKFDESSKLVTPPSPTSATSPLSAFGF